MKSFASDNTSAVHPTVMQALNSANSGCAKAYGDDALTAKAHALLQEAFGQHTRPWLVFLGTAANVLGLKSIMRPHHAVLCPATAHINVDECGSPEAVIGCKLLHASAPNGKLCLETCQTFLTQREAVHCSYPQVVSISQLTECGTAYTVEELHAIGAFCRANNLYLHMDGARLANAAAALGVSLRALTTTVGVDVLSFGGTKNGLMAAEAVVFLNPQLGHDFPYLRKQHMQLASKMRYVAAQFVAYLENELWRENATAANQSAALLAGLLQNLDHVRFAYPTDGNMLFVRMPEKSVALLAQNYYFYVIDTQSAPGFPEGWPLVRLMTSFTTTEQQVLEFARAIAASV